MNLRRGFFRLWLVLSVCWIAVSAIVLRDDLTATYSPKARAEWARQSAVEKTKSEECRKTKPAKDCEEFIPDWPPQGVFDDEQPDWYRIIQFLPLILGPPAAFIVVGWIIGWIASGFRRRA